MTQWIALAAATLFLAAAAHAETPAFDVLSYDVRIAPNFETQTVSGQTTIEFKSTADGLTTLSFSANALEVNASLDGESMVATEVQGDRRLFHLPHSIDKGKTALLAVTFKGKAPRGLVWGKDHVYANYFTCDYQICDQDRPGDKAKVAFELAIPPDMETVAPGGFSYKGTKPGRPIRRWFVNRPVAPYLLGFAAGRFTVTATADKRVSFVLSATGEPDKISRMFHDTLEMMEFFEAKAGVAAANQYTQVLVPGGEAQEAESHSIIGLDNIAPILQDPHEDWVIAHELAHQWWGNAVTCADWSELWLNEGLAVFMSAAWKEHRWGRADYDRELALANKRWEAAKQKGFDVPLSWQGKYPSLGLKRAMAYAKAVVFLDTLRRELGEDAFWRGIKLYTRTNWDKTVRAQDLQRAFERSSKRDLTKLFHTWVYG